MAEFSYLALGDSYTIGEDVPFDQNFPSQLLNSLGKDAGRNFGKPDVIATTGWTTDELLQAIKAAGNTNQYQMVSLLIGVNNQYRAYSKEQFEKEFGLLLKKAMHFAGNQSENVLVISIPDYGCTPFGAPKAEEIYTDLLWYNGEIQRQADLSGIRFADIFPVSRLAATEPELTASDRLHPSGAMYAKWVEVMLPQALAILKRHLS